MSNKSDKVRILVEYYEEGSLDKKSFEFPSSKIHYKNIKDDERKLLEEAPFIADEIWANISARTAIKVLQLPIKAFEIHPSGDVIEIPNHIINARFNTHHK